jgi:ankyrin repeat protein
MNIYVVRHYAILCKGNALLYVIMFGEKGMKINIQNNEGDPPLILCAKNGAKENIRIIQKLLELKADSNIKNKKGESFYSILNEEAKKENFECNSVIIKIYKCLKSDEEDTMETETRQYENTQTNIHEENSEITQGNKKVESISKYQTSGNKNNLKLLFFYLIFPIIFLILSIILGS